MNHKQAGHILFRDFSCTSRLSSVNLHIQTCVIYSIYKCVLCLYIFFFVVVYQAKTKFLFRLAPPSKFLFVIDITTIYAENEAYKRERVCIAILEHLAGAPPRTHYLLSDKKLFSIYPTPNRISHVIRSEDTRNSYIFFSVWSVAVCIHTTFIPCFHSLGLLSQMFCLHFQCITLLHCYIVYWKCCGWKCVIGGSLVVKRCGFVDSRKLILTLIIHMILFVYLNEKSISI